MVNLYKAIFEDAGIGCWIWDLPENSTYVSPVLMSMLGYSEEELSVSLDDLKKLFSGIIVKEDYELIQVHFREHIRSQSKTAFVQKIKLRHKNESIRHVVCTGRTIIWNEKGGPLRMAGSCCDVTLQEEALQELHRTEDLLNKTNQAALVGGWEIDVETNRVSWTKVTKEIYEVDDNFEPDIESATNFFKEGADREKLKEVLAEAIATGKNYDLELQIVTMKGNIRWLRVIGHTECYQHKCVHIYGAFQDITNSKYAEEKLNVIFEYSTDAHFLLSKGGIIDCNRAALNMIGCESKEEMLSVDPAIFSPQYQPDGRNSVEKSAEMNRIAFEKGFHRFEWMYKKFNGEVFPVEVTLNPVRINDAPVLLGIWHDISVQKEAREALIRAKELAEQAAMVKSQFLSTMSHEIRTPMNAIIGFTHLLMQNPRPDQINKLKTLKFSAENLLVLINDILDFNKIEAGMIEFEEVDFSVKELIINIKETMIQKAKEKDIELRLLMDDRLPELLIGDPVRLGQIIINLVSNAIKFTAEGSVVISAMLSHQDSAKTTISFEVMDTGIGIPEDKQQYIFESFAQASSDTTRKYGGTGLGLTITRRLLELQGSSISLKSKLGEGSVFSFELTFLNSSRKPEKAEITTFGLKESLKGIRLLIAEDTQINVLVAQEFFAQWDVECDVAENGLLALELIKINDYDLVLMDLQMPEMDGYETTRKVRELDADKYKQLPIIALTAATMLDIQDKAFLSGMNDYISKPFNPDELYNKIRLYGTKKLVIQTDI